MKTKSPLISSLIDAGFYAGVSLATAVFACYAMLVTALLGMVYVLLYAGMLLITLALPIYIIPTLWISIPMAMFLLLWGGLFLGMVKFDSKWRAMLTMVSEKIFRLKYVKNEQRI